ncbi:flagellar hook-associated protein FlgK [Zobellella aerophila]|uniref:Flagellar hook-associated protein 1 n=1 Tax=Zobellella aerophila TaxID=870480 RepID=A0ABP6VSS3_9GAMM
MSIFSIGVSGLNAAQQALYTAGNNISNVYTPGYNREVALLGESNTGGVKVNDIQRQFSQFVASQLNASSSKLSSLQTYETQVSQIDSLLADQEAGLAPLMQKFFSSLEDLAGTPSDPAARQGLLGTADTLTAQFRSFDDYLSDIQQGINGQIRDEVIQINNTAEQIAGLNREIGLAKAKTGSAPNSLLNQRDQLVAELSQRADVRLNIQDGGTYNLTIGNGQPLVAGSHSYRLEAMGSSADPSRMVVGYNDSAGNLVELKENTFKSGTLGGLLSFRSETLDKAQNQLGQLAVSLAQGFNARHKLGVDLNGEPGKDFFAVGEPLVYSNADNTGNAELGAVFGDINELSASSYDLRFDGGDMIVTRRDTGAQVAANYDASAGTLRFGGMELTLSGTPQAGDRFHVNPVQRAAGGFQNLIRDTAGIAAGLEPGSGDNRNALALQDLQNKQLVGGKATFNQAYGALVSDVGNRTNVVKVNLAAQQGLNEQLRGLQQSESGVNLDEEAANLLRYQQYYQANAKVIEVGSTVIDTLLGLRA